MATDLVIGLGAEWTGRGAFSKASREVSALDRAVGKLGKQFATVFAARKLYQFGKSATQAFLQDDAAAAQLNQTIKNLGLAYFSVDVESFINKMQTTTGVLDDQLRPAFSSLIIATRDYAKSQELLGLALDVSAGTGKDLDSVTRALGRAYQGNYKAIVALQAGITKADVASNDFSLIQQKLTEYFKGNAIKATETLAGKVKVLSAAYDTFKENVGEGIILGAENFFNASSVNDLSKAINEFGLVAGQVFINLGQDAANSGLPTFFENLAGYFTSGLSVLKSMASGQTLPKTGQQAYQDLLLQAQERKQRANTKALEDYYNNLEKLQVKQKEIDKANKLAAAADAKAKADAVKKKKEAQLIDQASKVFNLDAIQNVAALQGKVTEDEKQRLLAQQALLMGNADVAAKLTQELVATQIAALQTRAADPFGGWNKGAEEALATLQKIRAGLAGLGVPTPKIPDLPTPPPATNNVPSIIESLSSNVNYQSVGGQALINAMAAQAIKVEISMKENAADFVTATTVGNSANGNQNSLSRNFNFSSGL